MSISPRLAAAAAFSAAAFFSTSAFASDPPTFAPPQPVFTATPAVTTVMGDFDGDGIPDVAVLGGIVGTNGGYIGGSVEIRFGDGSNGFRSTSATIALNFSGSYYLAMAAADLNGGGQSQLVIAGTNIVVIYNWTGGVNFTESQVIDLTDTGITGTFVTVGDLTKHGSADILVSDRFAPFAGSVGLVWIPNDGKGNLGAPKIIPTFGCITPPVLADVNGDGLIDVVLDSPIGVYDGIGTNFSEMGATVGVLLNNGNGTMGSEVFWGVPKTTKGLALYGMTNSTGRVESLSTDAVAVADVDGDGKADLISACVVYDGNPDFTYTYYLSVNLGNGDGTFQDGIAFPVTNGIAALAAADINGDGRVDLVTVDAEFLDQIDPGFMVSEFSGLGANLTLARQTDFPAGRVNNSALSYHSLALGYKSTNGTFVTFNNNPRIDVLLGSGQKIYDTDNAVHYQFVVFNNNTGTTLPPTSLVIFGKPTNGAPLIVFVQQPFTAPGVTVRIQYTTATNIESSWTDLPGGGQLHSTVTGIYSFGTSGTLAYPGGAGIYFRAITSAPNFTDSISATILGPYTLEQAEFTINVRETSTSDPSGKLSVVHIGDNLNFTFIWTNIGNATARDVIVLAHVPTYQDAATDLHYQFARSNITFASYGNYVPESTPGAGDAEVWWHESDLPPGSSQAVTLTAQIGPSVRLDQDIAVLNDYEVYSGSNQPPTAASGASSGAPNEFSRVLGPFSMTITPDVAAVAPGGFINYTIKVHNLASYTITNVVIADPVPEFSSFVSATFLTAAGAPVARAPFIVKVGTSSMKVANPLRLIGLYPLNSQPVQVQTFLAANPEIAPPSDHADQVVFFAGNLAKGASVFVRLKVQAQFLDPADVTDHEIKNVDYLAYFTSPSGSIVESINDSGIIATPDQGAVLRPPNLSLLKNVSSQSLAPGDTFLVEFLAHNAGSNAANDVFIQDLLPTSPGTVNPVLLTTNKVPQVVTAASSQLALNSTITFIGGGSSITQSKLNYFVTLDPGGAITVHGLHLDPNKSLAIYYTMMVPANTPVPESNMVSGASFIGAGNGNLSTNGTGANRIIATVPYGTPLQTPMQINGKIDLFTPDHPFEAVPRPSVSANPAATASQLDLLYTTNPNAGLIVKNSNPPAPIPGVQLYFIHYQNRAANVAKDVHLLFPTPPNTELYRASLVSNGNVLKLTSNQSISEPGKLGSGNVIFNLGDLAASGGGYAMVEVIILPTAISSTSSRIIASTPRLYQGAQPLDAPRKLDDSEIPGTIVYDGQNVPTVGVIKVVPQTVQQGVPFAVQFAIVNYGTIDLSDGCDVVMQAPAGTQITGITATEGTVLSSTLTSCDVRFQPHSFEGRTATGITIMLLPTGNAGDVISEDSITATFPYTGSFKAKAASIQVVSQQTAVPNSTITTVSGMQFAALGEMCVVPIGPDVFGNGQALVSGPTSLLRAIDAYAYNISDSGNGSSIMWGAASSIALLNLPISGNTDSQIALSNLVTIVAKGGGNIFNGPGFNLVAPDGESLINNETGFVDAHSGTVKQLLKAGGQSVVASGTGILPAAGLSSPLAPPGSTLIGHGLVNVQSGGHLLTAAGGVISNDGGSVISNDGGSVVSHDGGSVISNDGGSIVTHDGGSVVSHDGGSLIAQDGGSLISSKDSGALAVTQGGSIVASGAGN